MTDINGNIREWPAKAPGAIQDYELDLSSWMARAPGDILLSAAVVSITPPNQLSVTTLDLTAAPVVAAWLSGGVHGTEYSLVFQPVTANGRTDTFVTLIAVIDPVQIVAERIGPGQAL